MTQPNIIYMHSHDTGRYVQPYGHAVSTPNIQRLAEQGVTFTNVFCAAPTCSASRAGLLTGQIPHSCGQLGLVNRGFELRDRHKHIAATLRDSGYHTALIGVHHVARDALTLGYEKRIQVDLNNDGTQHVGEAAEKFFANPPDKPFFLAVGFRDTHRVYPVASEDDARYCMPPAPLPNTPETRKDMADFKAAVKRLDEGMGRVLAALDKSGLSENTLVVCTTDHGLAFPKMKCNLTGHGTGVMLIIRGPEGFQGGRICDALVSQVDLFPTLCDVASIDHPDWLQGKSLSPLANGQAEEINEEIFSELNFHAVYEPVRTVRTKRWRYIRRYTERKRPLMVQIDCCPSKDLLFKHGYADQVLGEEELYDVMLDPNESCNIAEDPSRAEALAEMRRRLDDWMNRTEDPLLDGPVPEPGTAFMSDLDDYSHMDVVKRSPKQM